MKDSFQQWAEKKESFNPLSDEAIDELMDRQFTLEQWRRLDGDNTSEILSIGQDYTNQACIFPAGKPSYLIPIVDLQEPEGVIRWSRQLLGKRWTTPQIFHEFWEIVHHACLRKDPTA